MKDDKLIKDESCIGQSTNMPLSNKKPQWVENWNNFRKEWAILNQGGLEEEHNAMIKQFISDLRQADKEALIKMLPESEHSLSHIYCEEMREQGFQGCKTKVKQLIKDYYENN